MKKILLTTTALTMLAGAATAEISLSGSARVGVLNIAGVTATSTRMRINFNASGETDGGLTFGAWSRIQINNGAAGTANSGAKLWIGNGTATLTVGNTGGAVASTAGTGGSGIGYTGLGFADGVHTGQTTSTSAGAGPNVVRVDSTLGSANVSLSGGNGNNSEIAANFSLGSATVGIGSILSGGSGSGVSVKFDAGSAKVRVQAGNFGGGTSWSVRGDFGVGAGTVTAYVGSKPAGSNYGIGYSQSLGGGATLALGYVSTAGATRFDAGVKFSF